MPRPNMDSGDESDFFDIWKRMQEAAEGARRHEAGCEGTLVRDHPSPRQLISRFMATLRASATLRSDAGTTLQIATSHIDSYLPCVHPANELQPLMISDMRLGMHHRGSKTLLRVLTPPSRMAAVMAIVEDEQGTAVLLQLYHQPDEAVLPARETVRVGKVCIVKEAYFKSAVDGSYSLRVDHVSDIVWLDDSDVRVPLQWKKPASTMDRVSEIIRLQGNSAVAKQSWGEARRLYSSAISAAETPEEAELAYLNRSLTNLRLGLPQQAMQDAIQGGDAASPSEKQLFRLARALYNLGDFEACLLKLQALEASHPSNVAVKPELDRVKARLHEQQTGEYDFGRMYKQARSTPPLIDCASYSASVEVRESPGKGRGLFTTAPVSAGQLLMCEKALAYSCIAEDGSGGLYNMPGSVTMRMGRDGLPTQTVQKLYHDGQLARSFADLHSGDHAKPLVAEADGHPVIDSFLVEKMVALNMFGTPRTNLSWCSDLVSKGPGGTKDAHSSTLDACGVWLLASRTNHSCMGNCRRSFIGDMLILRATRDLEAGSELLFSYVAPTPVESYAEYQQRLCHWGFVCDCELCTMRKATPAATLEERRMLNREMVGVFRGFSETSMPRMRHLMGRLEKTYAAAGPLRMELWDPYLALGAQLLARNAPAEAIKMTVKGLEAMGFAMVASPPLQDAQPPRLEVRQWGLVNEFTAWAFANMCKAYKSLARELCPAAEKLVETAHSMVVGEKDSARDVFPCFG